MIALSANLTFCGEFHEGLMSERILIEPDSRIYRVIFDVIKDREKKSYNEN